MLVMRMNVALTQTKHNCINPQTSTPKRLCTTAPGERNLGNTLALPLANVLDGMFGCGNL